MCRLMENYAFVYRTANGAKIPTTIAVREPGPTPRIIFATTAYDRAVDLLHLFDDFLCLTLVDRRQRWCSARG